MERFIERCKDIILLPKTTWSRLREEELTQNDILKQYLIILAAIPAVASFFGQAIIGQKVLYLGYYRVPFFAGLFRLILLWLLYIAAMYINAWIVKTLAPSFGGQKDQANSFKLVTFSFVPFFLAGVFGLIPALSSLYILGLYGVYLFYIGLPAMLDVPEEKTLSFTIVAVLLAIIVTAVLGAIANSVIPTHLPQI